MYYCDLSKNLNLPSRKYIFSACYVPQIILFTNTVNGLFYGRAISFSPKEKTRPPACAHTQTHTSEKKLYGTEWNHHSDKGKLDLMQILSNHGQHIQNNDVIQEFA